MSSSILHATPRALACRDGLPLAQRADRSLRHLPDGRVVADWFGCELSSVFQPIVDPVGQSVVAHEAFLRCHGRGEPELSPWNLFAANADDARLIALDRLARTLHVLNCAASDRADGLLFLNVHGRLLSAVESDHGAAFRRVVEALGLPPERIVIETPPAASRQPDLLSFVLRNYRQNGFGVAVNVESVEQWQRLLATVSVQYIKIDACTLCAEEDGPQGLDRLLEHAGRARVVITHVEFRLPDEWEKDVLVQGFAWGSPTL